MAVSGLLLAGCDKNNGNGSASESPYITVSSTVAVDAAGGSYSFTYSVANPTKDGAVSCYGDMSWISDISVTSSGTVTFVARENATGQVRSGNITVAYSYSEGVVNKRVGIVQDYTADPVLTVGSTSVTVSGKGGDYSFIYDVFNPVSDGVFDCTVEDVDWVSNVDLSVDGAVTFTVDENPEEGLRECEFTLTYTYGWETLTRTVLVVQGPDVVESLIWDGSVAGLAGTYEATGYAMNTSTTVVEKTWTVVVTTADTDEYNVYFSGLTPLFYSIIGSNENNRYSAGAVLRGYQLHIPSQVPGGTVNVYGTVYCIGYTPCAYLSNGSFYYYTTFPDLTLTYDEDTDSWTSDYGILLAGSTSSAIEDMATIFDAVIPTMTLKKVSSSTTVMSKTMGRTEVKNITPVACQD